jgi:predicted ATPase
VVDALSRHLRRLPPVEAAQLLPRNIHALARIFPVLGRVDVVAGARQRTALPPDPVELRRRDFTALKELLGHIADAQPLVLYVDDLQWGDADSVLPLRELVEPPEAPAMLVLGTYRADEVEHSPFLRDLFGSERRPILVTLFPRAAPTPAAAAARSVRQA